MESNQPPFLFIAFLGLIFLLSFWTGFRRMVRLRHLSKRRILNGLIVAVVILTVMTIVQSLGYFPDDIAAKFTMFLYMLAAGFFTGFALKMIVLRRKAKDIEYAYRSPGTELTPPLIAILVIAFGIYRTGLLTLGPFTGISVTSGLSLVGFGLFGLTMNIVPEFRRRGMLILDQFVPWKKMVSYSWHSEETLKIEYLTSQNEITDFVTYIPPADQITVERLLTGKLEEYSEERRKALSNVDKKG